MGPQGTTGLFPVLSLKWLGETFLQIGDESLSVLIDSCTTLSVLHSTTIWQLLPRSTKTVQIMGISKKPQKLRVSEPIPFSLGSVGDTHPFLLSSSAPVYLLGQDFLEKYHARISFSLEREIILEFDSTHQNSQPGELNDPLTCFICSVSDGARADSGKTHHLSLLINYHPPYGQSLQLLLVIHSTPSIRIQIDPLKLLPRINQYPINEEALQGIKPTIEAYKVQSLVIPCTSPCNTHPCFTCKETQWQWTEVCSRPLAINNIVIPHHPVVPNPLTLLASISTESKFFTMIYVCSAFLSIQQIRPANLFTFTWEGQQHTWTVMHQSFTKSPSYFS